MSRDRSTPSKAAPVRFTSRIRPCFIEGEIADRREIVEVGVFLQLRPPSGPGLPAARRSASPVRPGGPAIRGAAAARRRLTSELRPSDRRFFRRSRNRASARWRSSAVSGLMGLAFCSWRELSTDYRRLLHLFPFLRLRLRWIGPRPAFPKRPASPATSPPASWPR